MFLRVLMVAALVIAATAERITLSSGSDSTLTPGAKGADVVERTMDVIKTACVFGDDKLFMRRLAYVESFDGADPDTYRTGYHGGIFQVDEVMFNKLKEPQSRQALSKYTKEFKKAFGKDWETTNWEDCRKPLVSALAARLYIQLAIDPTKKSFPRDIPDQGPFWSTYYRNGADSKLFIDAANKLNQGCKQIYGVDLVFILDSSGSVGSSNFAKMKKFVGEVVDSFDVSPDKTQVGVVTYSSSVYKNFYLNTYKTKAQVKNAVNKIRYQSGGTNTHLALDALYKTMFTSAKGARSMTAGVPRVGIFLTDGHSNNPSRTVLSALKVHDADITMFAVGVGSNTGKTELEAIASTPECLHLFVLKGFAEVDSLKYAIQKGTCDAPVIVGPGKNGTEVDGKVPSGGDQNCKIKVPAGGTTIQINAKSGAVKFFVSTNTYPSESYYDAMIDAVPGKPGVVFLQKPATADAEGIIFCNIKGDDKIDSEVDVGIIPGDVDHCKDVDCQNGGVCVDNLKDGYGCFCASGFEGTHCESVVDPCQNNPCFKGTCHRAQDGSSFTCTCDPGWKGTICNEPENACSVNPCKHGNCTSWGKNYECCCDRGWNGKNCDNDMNECDPNPCKHGKCRNQVGKYVCECDPGYTGIHCEIDIDECENDPCHQGECRNLNNDYECTCPPGWTGKNCETNIDDCTPNPCDHGTCTDGINSHKCSCSPGWTGLECDSDIDECTSNPCVHGQCSDRVNSFVCTCDSGWAGNICDSDIDECLSSPCKHGTCQDKVNGYVCVCKPGFTGILCDKEIDECTSNPCMNGGNCHDEVNGYKCRCLEGFEGTHCEINIDDCKKDPCEHGTCTDGVNDYVCTCEKGYTGKNCDCLTDNCVNNPCINGVCINGIGSYTCTCTEGFSGPNCDIGATVPPNTAPGYDCKRKNPCTAKNRAAGQYYFPHVNANKFIQCDAFGKCFIMPCPKGLKWNVAALTCT